MKAQLTLFAASIALGIIICILYTLQRLLSKKTALIPVTIALDFIWCGVSFAAFLALSVWLAGGVFYYYPVFGTLAGFFAATAALDAIKSRAAKRRADA